jgi:hypothetical protein
MKNVDLYVLCRFSQWLFCWVSVVLLSGIASCDLRAQQPCRLECDTSMVPFTVHEHVTSVSSDCRVKITAAVRSCGGMWEIEIRSIEYLEDCQGVDPFEVRRRSTSELVRANIMGLPTDNSVWRVSAPSCWRQLPSNNLVPCSSECCISTLKVEKRADCDKWSITAEGQSVVRPTCSLTTAQNGQTSSEASAARSCFFSCEPVLPTK